MAEAPIRETVSLSQPLTRETPRQLPKWRTNSETVGETPDLKSLARLVFARDVRRDTARDRAPRDCFAGSRLPRQTISPVLGVSAAPRLDHPVGTILDAVDLRSRYEERAAICEFDGGLDRARAEALAWREIAAIWYRQDGKRMPSHLCAGCGQDLLNDPNVFLLPHGERAHAGTGNNCVVRYGERWQRQAAIALAVIGIPTPPEMNIDASPWFSVGRC